MKVANSTLKELRGYVAEDQGRDVHMSKFVADTSELPDETPVRIIINRQTVEYAAFPPDSETVH